MSDLTFIEKNKLETLFQMGGGYVLDFSNRTLAKFVFNHVCSAVRFIKALEARAERAAAAVPSQEVIDDEIPF